MAKLLTDAALEEITEFVLRRLMEKGQIGKRLYTVAEAAEYLGCSVTQVRNWITAGKLKGAVLDARVRVDVGDLDRLIQEAKS
jgi:excisionase family DNA binding protein